MVLNKSSVDRGMFHGQIYQVCNSYLTLCESKRSGVSDILLIF